MTVIKLIRDDIGLLSLYRQNKANIDLEGDVEGVEPYPGIRPMAPKQQDRPPRSRDHRRHSAQTAQAARRQRGQDRRRRQRRQDQAAVLLDTRSGYERRTRLRRTDDQRQVDPDKPYTGFDDFA